MCLGSRRWYFAAEYDCTYSGIQCLCPSLWCLETRKSSVASEYEMEPVPQNVVAAEQNRIRSLEQCGKSDEKESHGVRFCVTQVSSLPPPQHAQ